LSDNSIPRRFLVNALVVDICPHTVRGMKSRTCITAEAATSAAAAAAAAAACI